MNAPAPDDEEEVGGPVLTPPVSAGPITASSLGGVPFLAVTGPVSHFSGNRLVHFVMSALNEAGLTIEPPQ
ncbi:hypothetical protein BB737_04920 [Mycobacterium avium subsp. hominissuis]|uniref:Uncharacterized protein n=4 Tax=Mycobacterium TaxID=1763 RepID=A0AA37QAH2_9MYCO|nr:hypothetical protein [Mycobacterium kyorinense]MBZ4631642.1 hypothetical protein [Mycobacterium avium subsp. hominissuis]ORA42157.1 hypothetical protein BST19_26125 [Mycobacterium bouchedurhonense]ORB76758.1 hypothetical protein BST46_28290 [Mycobacterium timonense]GLB86739.1 hypothetical protein SRL2020028_59950 [Mycobacterium kiyosense]PBJ35484.1 hypothetical protein XV03_10860 [Mycobacterium avium subsp. hominissuis]